ncbi:MAG: Holliday junction branch migration protein RuvA [Clostridia bacterium]|nr:Holliday junction branch migration protein RuvA [Clostridia bacterium]
MARLIDRLRGRILEKDPGRHEGPGREPASVVVEVGGVAFRAFVSTSSFERLPAPGGLAVVYASLLVREEALELFAFADPDERRLFHRLLSVANVGPRLALAVLGLGAPELRRAVAQGDWRALASVPGVGRKTAERIALELRDAGEAAFAEAAAADELAAVEGDPYREAALALRGLGYSPGEAARALAALPRGPEPPSAEALVRLALRVLAGGAP